MTQQNQIIWLQTVIIMYPSHVKFVHKSENGSLHGHRDNGFTTEVGTMNFISKNSKIHYAQYAKRPHLSQLKILQHRM